MTCKDCIHYEICCDEYELAHAENCNNFKDKLKIVELPCKVGGTVFITPNQRDFYKAKLYGKNENGAYFVEVYATFIGIPLDNPFYDWHFDIYTKEQAEARLKELQDNATL